MAGDIQVSTAYVTSTSPMFGDVEISAAFVSTLPTQLEPYQVVTLPSGVWSYTSGPTVTMSVDGRTFTTPASSTGGSLVITEDAGDTLTFTVLPHTLFVASGSTWVPAQWQDIHN